MLSSDELFLRGEIKPDTKFFMTRNDNLAIFKKKKIEFVDDPTNVIYFTHSIEDGKLKLKYNGSTIFGKTLKAVHGKNLDNEHLYAGLYYYLMLETKNGVTNIPWDKKTDYQYSFFPETYYNKGIEYNTLKSFLDWKNKKDIVKGFTFKSGGNFYNYPRKIRIIKDLKQKPFNRYLAHEKNIFTFKDFKKPPKKQRFTGTSRKLDSPKEEPQESGIPWFIIISVFVVLAIFMCLWIYYKPKSSIELIEIEKFVY